MLLLLVSAAWVFTNARAITTQDTGGDLKERLATETTRYNADQRKVDDIRERALKDLEPIIQHIGEESSGSPDFTIEILNNQNITRNKSDVVNELSQNSKNLGHPSTMRFYFHIGVFGTAYLRIINSDNINNIPEWQPKDISQYLKDFNAIQNKLSIESQALVRLSGRIVENEIQTEMGEKNNDTSQDYIGVSLPFLLQLNITRFGTLTLVGIGIGILVPLYRFSARLSTFYRAQADALRFRQTVEKRVSFVRLASALTPRLDFGKSHAAVDHGLMELGRHMSEQEKADRDEREQEG
jgi:hypothetical protein